MLGKDIVKFIEENGLEDFELRSVLRKEDDKFPSYIEYELNQVVDIGYSENVVLIELKKKN